MTYFGCPKPLRTPIKAEEKRLLEIYPNLSAPAVKYKGQGYVTLHKTISVEEAIAYHRDENFIIATRPRGSMTNDIRLDLDHGGRYWDVKIIRAIQGLFEDYGLSGSFLCRSSHSEGRWLIIPLPEPMASWQAALTADSILRSAGYDIAAGDLEINPNVKKWVERGKEAPRGIKSDWVVDHNALRLPGQEGFAILDNDGNPIGTTLKTYLSHWDWAKSQQSQEEWEEAIAHFSKKENRPKPKYRQQGRGLKAIQQEHEELLARGFTDTSQTNDIGLNLARRLRILCTGDLETLTQKIKESFIAMSGYREHCQHQHEIERRARDLARWADKNWSHYGDQEKQTREKQPHPNRNEARHANALNKAMRTLKHFLKNEFRFKSKSQIFEAMKKHCGLGKKTFYKYLKQIPAFTRLVSLLRMPETQTEQESQQKPPNQFTPPTTKRRGRTKFSLLPPKQNRKHIQTPNIIRTSTSAQEKISSLPITPNPADSSETEMLSNVIQKSKIFELFAEKQRENKLQRRLVRACKALHRKNHPELLAELNRLAEQCGIEQLEAWVNGFKIPAVSEGFKIWSER